MILATPPTGKKIFVVMPDDDQIYLKSICKAGNFIDGVSRDKVHGCVNVSLPKSGDSFLKHGLRVLFVDDKTD